MFIGIGFGIFEEDVFGGASPPPPPSNGYVAENGTTNYVAEDGSTYYVQESGGGGSTGQSMGLLLALTYA